MSTLEYTVIEQDGSSKVTEVSDIRFLNVARTDAPATIASTDAPTIEEILLDMQANSHKHGNMATLNKLGTDAAGHLTMNGNPVTDLSSYYTKTQTNTEITDAVAGVLGMAGDALAALTALGDIAVAEAAQEAKIDAAVARVATIEGEMGPVVSTLSNVMGQVTAFDSSLSTMSDSLVAKEDKLAIPSTNGQVLIGNLDNTKQWVSSLDLGEF